MNYTPNYEFHLPERNEQFNLDDWNYNITQIDSKIKTNQTATETNADDIANILSNLTVNKANDSSSTYFKLMKLIYPIGSIYWSGNATNPATLFGGTWVQIKDRFVWAKGNSDTLGATGGEKTHTLTTSEMPSHTHVFSGSEVTTGNNSANPSFSWSGSHTHSSSTEVVKSGGITIARDRGDPKIYYGLTGSITLTSATINVSGTTTGSHTHKVTASGTNANSGGGNAHNNMPPYVVKYCWERTA